MQFEEANRLEEAWKKSGKPPHEDHRWSKEYHFSMDLGDYRCTICGETQTPAERRASKNA